MIQGLYFTVSYDPTVDTDVFRLSLNIAASGKIIVVFINASNAFQINATSDPIKRVCITLPVMDLEWFRARFQNH